MCSLKEYLRDYYKSRIHLNFLNDISGSSNSSLDRMFIFGRFYNSVMGLETPKEAINHNRNITSFENHPVSVRNTLKDIEISLISFKEHFYIQERHYCIESEFKKFLELENEIEIEKMIQHIRTSTEIFLGSISNLSLSVPLN